MLPICIKCSRFFRPIKNGFWFTEGMPVVDGAQPGLADADKWKPYKIWASDKFECPGCGVQILSGFGRAPISEHYKPDFAEWQAGLKADQFQVNDCC